LIHLDERDKAIIQALQENGQRSLRQLAKIVNMSAPAVGERLRRLKEQKVITGYTILVDQNLFPPLITSYITLNLRESSDHEALLEFVDEHEEIRECHRLAGGDFYLMKVEIPNQDVLNSLLSKLLRYGYYRHTLVVASVIKDRPGSVQTQ
jgi:Lrp/AsnC family leucine-responsive transcriptional regulator